MDMRSHTLSHIIFSETGAPASKGQALTKVPAHWMLLYSNHTPTSITPHA
jgi:hypothetical protein